MTVQPIDTTVYFTVLENGTHLATAVCGPCFAVSGSSFEEVKARVAEIFAFHAKRTASDGNAALKPEISAKLNRQVRPFAPSYVQRYPVAECVAA